MVWARDCSIKYLKQIGYLLLAQHSLSSYVNILENGRGHGEDAINGLSHLVIPVMFFRQAKAWDMSFCTRHTGVCNVYGGQTKPDLCICEALSYQYTHITMQSVFLGMTIIS